MAGLANVSDSTKWSGTNADIGGAESLTNGAQNTTDIVADASCTGSPTDCAAYQCRNNFMGGSYTDWYLPAICEAGFDGFNFSNGCGTSGSPTLQNMQSNLVDIGNVCGLAGPYWSSTEYSGFPTLDAWSQTFGVGSGGQANVNKSNTLGVRCSRALTF